MESVGCFILLFIYQAANVRPDGIGLPMTTMSYKSSPKEQDNLKLSFTANNDVTTPYKQIIDSLPKTKKVANTKSIETTNTPYSDAPIQNSPQSESTEIRIPIYMVSKATPVNPILDINPKLHTMNTLVQIPSLNSNTAQTSQTSSVSHSMFSNSGGSAIDSNKISNCCLKSSTPVVVPSYFIINKDTSPVTKIPLTPLNLESIPSNVCKVKVNDAQPIFIDCSKSTYKIPSSQISTKVITAQPVDQINIIPESKVVHYVDSNPLLKDNFVSHQMPLNLVEDIPVSQTFSYLLTDNTNCNKFTVSNEEKIQTESLDTVLCPINNIIFNYGPNIFSENTEANIDNKDCSLIPQDNIIIQPITTKLNFVSNELQSSEYNVQVSEYQNNKNNVNANYCSASSTLSLNNQPNLYIKDSIEPISQLPKVLANSWTLPTSLPQLSTNLIAAPTFANTLLNTQTPKTDSFTSSLSSSLNNIVSSLTASILSKVIEKTSSTSSSHHTCTSSSNDPLRQKDSNIRTPVESSNYLTKSTTSPSHLSFPTSICLPSIDLESLNISTVKILNDLYGTASSSLVTAKKSNPKPYLSSITINIMADSSNDIIIVV